MKFLLILLISFGAHAQSAKLGTLSVTIDASGTPEVISTAALYVREAYISAASSNTGLIYIGVSGATATADAGTTLTKGSGTLVGSVLKLGDLSNGASPKINLADIWAGAATNADRVNVFYVE